MILFTQVAFAAILLVLSFTSLRIGKSSWKSLWLEGSVLLGAWAVILLMGVVTPMSWVEVALRAYVLVGIAPAVERTARRIRPDVKRDSALAGMPLWTACCVSALAGAAVVGTPL